MYEVFAELAQAIQSGSRTFTTRLSIDGTPIDAEIKSLRLNGGSNVDGDNFAIGTTVSQYIESTIAIVDTPIENKEILFELGIYVGATPTYIPMGYFTARKPKTDESGITFTAFDRMIKLEKLFTFSASSSTNTIALLNRISTITGVSFNTTGLTAIPMEKPEGLTCREVLGYVAQQYGGFAICDRDGRIVIKTYTDANLIISPDIYWDTYQHNDYNYTLDGITCVVGTDENGDTIKYEAGEGTRRCTFSNPYMTQTDVNRVWEILADTDYSVGTLKFLGDPRIDPWDIITIRDLDGTSYKVPAMSFVHEFDGGLTTTLTSYGKSESEESINYTGPITKYMERYYAQLVTIDNALINKLDVHTAEITYATIQGLDASNARIDTLSGNVAQFQTTITNRLEADEGDISYLQTNALTATSGTIVNLNSDVANVKTLLAGNAGAGTLQTIVLNAQNASIDSALIKQLVSQNIAVNDLLAGDIITNRQRIISQDGSFEIDGSTQTIKDENGNVRIQIGRDANNNFTFTLFDETGSGVLIDSDGIKENAIADGLIKDAKVANDANIKGSKLDIASVISAVNGSTSTINSNHIYFDDRAQTLTQVYTQMSSDITSLSSDMSTVQTTAQTASENAQRAIQAVESISTLDNLTGILSNDAHVVHTLYDGTGGVYTDVNTQVYVYRGDTDVTDYASITVSPSASVTGNWDSTTKVYQVTNLSGMDGYVDFEMVYGLGSKYLLMPDENRIIMPDGNILTLPVSATVVKRFSISKSPDGRVGTSYHLASSIGVIRKLRNGTLSPSSVAFSASYSDGTGLIDYYGIFVIETSSDGNTWTTEYTSSSAEKRVVYTPSSVNLTFIRVTLYDPNNNVQLDTNSVTIIADADELASELDVAQASIQSVTTRVGNVESSVNGLSVSLEETQTELQGFSDGTIIFQTPYLVDVNTVTANAKVYKGGEDITSTFPANWFEWVRRTENSEEKLGNGYSITVSKELMGYGGVIIGRFYKNIECALLLPDDKYLIMPDNKRLMLWVA